MRYKQPRQYIEQALAGAAVHESHSVALHDLPFEFMMNALRLTDGFAIQLYEERPDLH
jgi:oxygen-independent coproporphyrinogen-3 oxidase